MNVEVASKIWIHMYIWSDLKTRQSLELLNAIWGMIAIHTNSKGIVTLFTYVATINTKLVQLYNKKWISVFVMIMKKLGFWNCFKFFFSKDLTNYGCLFSYCVSNYSNGHFNHQSYVMYKISAIQVIYKSNAKSTSKKSKPW